MKFSQEHPDIAQRWYETSNNLVVLQVPTESCLKHLANRALDTEVPYVVNEEPDYENAVTSVALGPAGRKLVSNFPLALRNRKPRTAA